MSGQRGSHVYLNVYDLIEHNDWTYWCGVGIFHSGVEVYGVEYAYGGHEYEAPGVFATNPREAPGTVTWRQAIDLGETSLAPTEVYAIVQQMGAEYRGNAYHLLQMNCNTFSDDFARRLTGRGAPPWVNRLANFAVTLHCLLPQGWVPPLKTPGAVPDALFDVDDHDAAQRSSTGESARLLASRPGSRSDAPQLAVIQRAPSGASMAAPYSSAAQLVM